MKYTLGVEINEQYLKLVTAKSIKLKPAKLDDCVVESISSLADDHITARIVEILRAWKFKPNRVVLCLPRNFVTVRNLHLPSQDPQEIMQMINLHIGRVVPYKKEEIVFGNHSLGIDEMGYTKELAAIVHIDIVRRQTRILEKAGLYIDDIGLSSYGAWHWVLGNYRQEIDPNELYLLLDVDSLFTDFIVFSRSNLLFTRNIPIKINANLTPNEITKFIGEVKQSLVIFQNEELNKKPVNIFLTGSEISKDLYKVTEDELDIPVKVVPSPFSPESIREAGRGLPRDASLIAAADLVLEDNNKGLSFVLPEIQIRRALKEKTRDLTLIGSLIIYFFSVIVLMFLGRLYNAQSYLKRINRHSESIKKDVGELINQSKKVEFVKDFLRQRRLALLCLSEIQKSIPEQISVDYLSIDESSKITVRGQANQLADVFRFVGTLEKTEYFKDVVTKYTRTKKLKDREVNNFEIEFQFFL